MKKLKYLLFLFTFLLITDVNGLQLGRPETFTYFSDGTEVSGNASSIGYWGTDNYWQGASKIGSFTPTSSNAYGIQFYWNGANLCQDKDISISGTIVGWSDFFDQQAYHVDLIMNNQPLTCSFTKENSSRIKYTCYGKGGGSYSIFFTQDSFYGSYLNYDISVSKNVELSCDVSNEAIVNQSITNTQNIINNQNQNTQDIINNNSSNTQDIIDNQNQNTQDIIDNQNQNTEQQIESQKVCSNFTLDKDSIVLPNSYLSSNGAVLSSSTGNGISDYYEISSDTSISIIEPIPERPQNACFYTSSKTLISCFLQNSVPQIPQNAKYIRFTLNTSNINPRFSINSCQNGNQALNDSVTGLNDTLNDTSSPDTENEINDLKDDLISDTPITDLITLPISLLNSYINGFSGTCSSYNLGNLYGTDLILPCLNLQERLGSELWSLIDSLFSIFMIYNIAMLMIQAFEGFTSLRDDYESLYQPKHADTGYVPKHGGGS